MITEFSKEGAQMTDKHLMFNTLSHPGNANHNYFIPASMLRSTKQVAARDGEDVT